MSRVTRILLVAAIALVVAAPSAGATPTKKMDSQLAALWTTVLQTPTAQNSFGTGGLAFACWDLRGTVAPFVPFGLDGVATCTVKPGTKVFVTASSVECSSFEGQGTTDAVLRECAIGSDADVSPVVVVDGRTVTPSPVETPLLNITLPADNVFGQPAGTTGQSVAHGWVMLLNPMTPGTHTIVIGTGATSITTMIVVKPGH